MICGKRLKIFLVLSVLFFLPLLASYSGEVYEITEEELTRLETTLTEQRKTLQEQAETLKAQERTMQRLNSRIETQQTIITTLSKSFSEYENAQKRKTISVGIASGAGGIVLGGLTVLLLTR